MMLGAIRRWWTERVPISSDAVARLVDEPVPGHLKRWWFALGGTPAYLFVVQIITGILLAIYYQPSSTTAYDSVVRIQEEVAFGWYLRGLHRWGATLMIAAVVLHQMRVYFTGAYRRPREFNWVVGMFLLLTTLGLGFTGYSLVYEELSYWGATVGANILDQVPLVGTTGKRLLLGGSSYGETTLSRFYVLHAAILPGTLILLVGVHIALVRMHGVTELKFAETPRSFRFAPDHLLTEVGIGLVLMIVLSALASVFPAALGPEADPTQTPDAIQPEWFFYVTFRWLKLFSGTAAVLSLGFIVFVMIAWPAVDAVFQRSRYLRDASFWIGVVAVIALVGMTVWEGFAAH